MSREEHDRQAQARPAGGHLDRRGFVRTVGAVGAVGAVGSLSASSLAAAPRTATPPVASPTTPTPQQAGDFAQPAGIRPGGQSDSRFPVSFAEPISQSLRLVMDYFTALNQRDIQGIADTLHFPFAINEDIEPIAFQNAG